MHGLPGNFYVFYALTPPGREAAFYEDFQTILRREGIKPNPGINDTEGVRRHVVESTNFHFSIWAVNTVRDPRSAQELGKPCKGQEKDVRFWPREFGVTVATMRPFGSDARSKALSDRLKRAVGEAGYQVQDERFPCGGEVLEEGELKTQ